MNRIYFLKLASVGDSAFRSVLSETKGNSPAFQRWDGCDTSHKSRQGRKHSHYSITPRLRAAIEAGTRIEAVTVIKIRREGEEREILPIHIVLEIKHPRETGAGDLWFLPRTVRFLPIKQKSKAALDAMTIEIAARADAHHSPGRLGCGAFSDAFHLRIVIRRA